MGGAHPCNTYDSVPVAAEAEQGDAWLATDGSGVRAKVLGVKWENDRTLDMYESLLELFVQLSRVELFMNTAVFSVYHDAYDKKKRGITRVHVATVHVGVTEEGPRVVLVSFASVLFSKQWMAGQLRSSCYHVNWQPQTLNIGPTLRNTFGRVYRPATHWLYAITNEPLVTASV